MTLPMWFEPIPAWLTALLILSACFIFAGAWLIAVARTRDAIAEHIRADRDRLDEAMRAAFADPSISPELAESPAPASSEVFPKAARIGIAGSVTEAAESVAAINPPPAPRKRSCALCSRVRGFFFRAPRTEHTEASRF